MDGVNTLVDEAKDGKGASFSALENKLTGLLTDTTGGTPTVEITPSDTNQTSSLDIEVVLEYDYLRSDDMLIDLEEILGSINGSINFDPEDGKIISSFSNGLVPDVQGSATILFNPRLKLTLALGLEYDKTSKTMKPYFRGSTGLEISLNAQGNFDFNCTIGPLKGYVNGEVKVGESSSRPISFFAGLAGGKSQKHFITDVSAITSLQDNLELVFDGIVTANIVAEMDSLFFPPPLTAPKIEATLSVPDLAKAIQRSPNALITSVKVNGPGSLSMPSFFDFLLKDPQALVDAIDDMFDRIEQASLGPDGIITNFPAPLINKGIADALGAGQKDNVIATARRNIVQILQERLDSYDEEPDTMAEVLANELQRLLENDSVDLIAPNKTVSVACFNYNKPTMTQTKLTACNSTDPKPTSLMWTVPFGQEYKIELDLDFDVDGGSFPLAMSLQGNSTPTLTLAWEFSLGFGFDEKEGFFISTSNLDGSELKVMAWFTLENKTVDATLFFLKAHLSDLDIHVAAGIFVDIVKPAKLDKDGPMKGRMTRIDLRKLTRPSELFEITATAGATIQTPIKTWIDMGKSFETVAKYVPTLEGEIAVQLRKETKKTFTKTNSKSRNLLSDPDRRRLGSIGSDTTHPAIGVLRWLSDNSTERSDNETAFSAKELLNGSKYGPNWEPCPVASTATICASMHNLTMDIQSIKEAILPITEKFVNAETKDGYLDKIIEPFLFLDEPLPGLSELTGDDTSVLDIAYMYYPESGSKTVKAILKMYKDLQTLQTNLLLGDGKLLLASKCDILKGFECSGGMFDETTRSLEGRCDKNCNGCSKAKKLACKANKVEGLSFPFLSNPADAIKLLQGEDLVSTKRFVLL